MDAARPEPVPDAAALEPSAAESPPAFSQLLRSVADDAQGSVSLGKLADMLRGRAHALALLILVLPETIPLPVPSISIVLGVPLTLVAGHLVLHGESAGLPARVREMRIPTSVVRAVNRWVGPILAWLEMLSRTRWRAVAEHTRLVGLLCLYLAIVLFLPLPFVNLAPAICLAVVALGLIRHDGLFILLGFAGALLLTVALVFSGFLATSMLQVIFVR
jgi:hypothetical protein